MMRRENAGLGRRGLLGLGAAAVVAPLAGCGFQPVYMPTASGRAGPAAREMQAIYVDLIPDRPGQLLRQALQQRLQGSASGVLPRYDLSVVYWIGGEGIAIQPDNSVTRLRLVGNANWTLIGRDPARSRVTTGFARYLYGFDLFDQQFFASDLQTQQAQQVIADQVADQIALRLAVFFRKTAAGQATA